MPASGLFASDCHLCLHSRVVSQGEAWAALHLYESWRSGEPHSNMSYQDIALLSTPRLIPPHCAELLLLSSNVINFHIPEDGVI